MEVPESLRDIPHDLFGVIGNYLNYEDIRNLEKIFDVKILHRVTQINCSTRYTLETAPRIDIINDKRKKYQRDLTVMYSAGSYFNSEYYGDGMDYNYILGNDELLDKYIN